MVRPRRSSYSMSCSLRDPGGNAQLGAIRTNAGVSGGCRNSESSAVGRRPYGFTARYHVKSNAKKRKKATEVAVHTASVAFHDRGKTGESQFRAHAPRCNNRTKTRSDKKCRSWPRSRICALGGNPRRVVKVHAEGRACEKIRIRGA